MLCDLCHKNEATFFVEQTSKTGKRKLHFCAECVRSRGFSTDPKEISKALNSLFAEIYEKEKSSDMACPVCGQHLSRIKLTGLTGCPECYEIFKSQIIEYMKKQKIYGEYKGQMPERISTFRSVLTDRIDVMKKLELAVKNEDYEKAAFYRDYLHAIENKAVFDSELDQENND
ncbi:MAG: UvrB/UvrC motif-containing protein [Treponema sp.]|uniref:UvrB/UvrC motif-containing protein n=1 Tax=Treponema sp. TaxID=166 RepID=UPI001B6C8D39|nr:UvrB/UvrC motif-containing protein [Treponema sp.]MBP5402923.1 UvrB/UvrC motif-containing protein [Treponema sp.]MBR5932977.1 UvrB/UvrC motif-containing protein [Treponema sp.]